MSSKTIAFARFEHQRDLNGSEDHLSACKSEENGKTGTVWRRNMDADFRKPQRFSDAGNSTFKTRSCHSRTSLKVLKILRLTPRISLTTFMNVFISKKSSKSNCPDEQPADLWQLKELRCAVTFQLSVVFCSNTKLYRPDTHLLDECLSSKFF